MSQSWGPKQYRARLTRIYDIHQQEIQEKQKLSYKKKFIF